MKRMWISLLAVLLVLLLGCGLTPAALAVDDGGAAVTAVAPEAGAAVAAADKGYTLREDAEIAENETPLAAVTVETRCVLHVLLFVLAAAVGVYFLYSRQKHRARQRELMARLRR